MTSSRPSFSIITTCKGRLDHLRESLPAMLAQADSEVIVVDFSCPDEAAAYVEEHFPKARTVKVEGEEGFSNWRARNAGAAVAKSDFLIFCDADIVLASDATRKVAKRLTAGSFGYFENRRSAQAGGTKSALALNQLKGFQVIPLESFRKVGGYDELLTGYAAGGDTELEERLRFLRLELVPLELDLIERVVAHDDKTRMRFHGRPAIQTYLVGSFYRWIKIALMGIRKGAEPDLKTKEHLHGLARQAATSFLRYRKATEIKLQIVDEPLTMFWTAGSQPPRLRVTINVEVIDEPKPASGS